MTQLARPATVARWLAGPLPADVARSVDRLSAADDVRRVAVMPDVHLAEAVCVGVAVATSRLLYPAAVGGDLGCGMAAVALDVDAGLLRDERAAARALAGLYRCVPCLKHAARTLPAAIPADLAQAPLSAPRLEAMKQREGRLQFGTLGRGNHFIEFQADPEDRLWLMVHGGSRAIGQAITAHHLGPGRMGPSNNLSSIDAGSPAGQAYLRDLDWAIAYARSNRRAMLRAVEGLMRRAFNVALDWRSLIDADHNHVRREAHFGETLWVHRKGALSASEGEPGLVPGSMGTVSYHVLGRGCEASLRSCSHGAGRALSRTEARRAIGAKEFSRQLAGVWFDHRLINELRDEAPSAYKDVRAVMRAQRELTRIVRELRPVLVYKGVDR